MCDIRTRGGKTAESEMEGKMQDRSKVTERHATVSSVLVQEVWLRQESTKQGIDSTNRKRAMAIGSARIETLDVN